jgi:hypothetical protein
LGVNKAVSVGVERIKSLLQSWRQLIFAEFAVAVLIELAQALKHCPATERSATTTPAWSGRSANSIGQRALKLVPSELTITVLIELLERTDGALDFSGRNASVTVGIQGSQHRDAGHHCRTASLAGRPTPRPPASSRAIAGRSVTGWPRIGLLRATLVVIEAGRKLIATQLAVVVFVAVI